VRGAARARAAARALRDFLRGFLGLSGAPGVGPAPQDPAAARRALEERAARRPTCC
jgi:hypothetical protein